MDGDFLTDTAIKWFQNLDYKYMILHIIVCYGLYHSKNWKWVWQKFSPVRKMGVSKAIWVVGLFLAVLEISRYLPYLGNGEISNTIVLSIVHSYVVIQVFVDPIVNSIHKWINLLKTKQVD